MLATQEVEREGEVEDGDGRGLWWSLFSFSSKKIFIQLWSVQLLALDRFLCARKYHQLARDVDNIISAAHIQTALVCGEQLPACGIMIRSTLEEPVSKPRVETLVIGCLELRTRGIQTLHRKVGVDTQIR